MPCVLKPHPTNICNNPSIRECVSCGSSSNHTSSDHSNYLLYTKNVELLDTRIPKNTLPYFPILGTPWTFVAAARSAHTYTPAHPRVDINAHPSWASPPHPPSNIGADIPAALNSPTHLTNINLTQATIDGNGHIICPHPQPIAHPPTVPLTQTPDSGWQPRHPFHSKGILPSNPNTISLPTPYSPPPIPDTIALGPSQPPVLAISHC